MHRYEAIRAELLQRIRAQVWPPGHNVPREEDLAAEFGVARGTIRRALASLVAAGLLERRKRAGTRVMEPTSHQSTLHIPIVRYEIESRGQRYGYRCLSSVRRKPSSVESQIFADTEIRHVQCVHLSGGKPYQFEDRLISLAMVPDAAEEDFAELSPNEWLVAQVPFSSVRTEMRAEPASEAAAGLLSIAVGEPLFTIERVTRLDDRPVTQVRMIHPGDQYSLITESTDLR